MRQEQKALGLFQGSSPKHSRAVGFMLVIYVNLTRDFLKRTRSSCVRGNFGDEFFKSSHLVQPCISTIAPCSSNAAFGLFATYALFKNKHPHLSQNLSVAPTINRSFNTHQSHSMFLVFQGMDVLLDIAPR